MCARAWALLWPVVLFLTACGLILASMSRIAEGEFWLCVELGTAGLAVFCAYLFLLNLRHRRAAQGSPPEQRGGHDGDVDLTWVFDEQRDALHAENLAAVPALVRMINEPAHSRTRTVESISLQGRVISQQVSMELHLPPMRCPAGQPPGDSTGSVDEIYIPALVVRKPELIDNLTIVDAQGQPLSVLSYEETIKLVAVALHFLVVTCTVDRAPDGSLRRPDSLSDVWQTEALLLQLIYDLRPRDGAAVDRQIDKAFEWFGLSADDQPSERVTWLREFVTKLSFAYPVIVALPREENVSRVVISYKRTLIPALDISGFRGRLRLAAGLRPYKVGIDTALAHISKAYHLQVDGPASQYLMEQTLRCQTCGGDLTRNGVIVPQHHTDPRHTHLEYPPGGDRPFFHLRGKHGQAYAHLYMRGFAAGRDENLVFSASFGETPPGTLASATITAAVSCLLIGAIGHAETGGISHNSDIPPLLLALPAAAASWFGFHSDGEAVLRSSLAARCSLLIGGLTSLLAAVVFLVTKRPDDTAHRVMPPSVFAMHLPSWWSVLFSIASVNMLCVFAQLVVRSWSYRRLLLRKETDGIQTGRRSLG